MANRKNLSCTMLLPGIRDNTRQADPYSIRQNRAHAYGSGEQMQTQPHD